MGSLILWKGFAKELPNIRGGDENASASRLQTQNHFLLEVESFSVHVHGPTKLILLLEVVRQILESIPGFPTLRPGF